MTIFSTNLFTVILDAIEALLLSIALFIVGPFSFLHNFSLGSTFKYIKVLLPLGLSANFVRALIDRKLGQTDRAVATLECTIGSIEEDLGDADKYPSTSVYVLADLYSTLTKTQLAAGNVDDAALSVLRAGRSLGVERLKGVPDFDVRIAQIIRAGIAAGKLLEQGGLTTVMLQQPNANGPTKKTKHGKMKRNTSSQGSDAGILSPEQVGAGAKVIPFPGPYLH